MTAIEHTFGHRQIGPVGTAVRLCVGAGLLVYALATGPTAFELLAGFVLLALSNLIRRRDDQLACAVFSPIDALEQTTRS